ncbi:SIS domain-containing protein [Methylosinus sporium]|uniref:Glutamine--fructose-6-phosphate aminotransferase n=2 Tax=Methylosinus sporium TaxID=428 RepID=A0A2U1SRB6_METSR|nr:SIS domain-containing protein [Methylosinus sporium]PWB94167.1 glutamine--fructose-6-phosphate aminotransferase [Methylosinus sporium]TRL35213.1 SIS domain-containing protein [Methylosinus sporium]
MIMRDNRMAIEAREAPHAVARQQEQLAPRLAPLVARLRAVDPRVVVTCARGSSAHAATFAKHLIERGLGVPVAAAAPNIASVYGGSLRLDGQLFLAISQSGGSNDLIELAAAARRSGAVTVCLVNEVESDLAAQCEFVLPMAAGPEFAVPATKTFIASLAALARLVASWSQDRALDDALARLPERLARACELDWSRLVEAFARAESLVAIGRGPTLAIAREAALKLKETANLHAEAFSSAEFMHGPVSLVSPLYPILMLTPTDEAAIGMRRLADDLRGKGAALFTTDREDETRGRLPALAPDHPETDAICLIQSFYAMAARLAVVRGVDVDRPRHLQKVTRTR